MIEASKVCLVTGRLVLQPFSIADAMRFWEIQSNWNVIRNLRAAQFPASHKSLIAWMEEAAREWASGTAYRFAIRLADQVIGAADVDGIAGGEGSLGYWLDEPYWGRGLATEAAGAVRDFAFGVGGLHALTSGHAADNLASGRILRKLGFVPVGAERMWSIPRQTEIDQQLYRLQPLS